MNVLVRTQKTALAPRERIENVERLTQAVLKAPQVQLKTIHHIHAGVYSRTIFVPSGICVSGLEIVVDTQLIISGHGRLTDGGVVREIEGYEVLDGLAPRSAAFVAIEDTWITMLFATKATTVEEAENEFCAQPERLASRKEKLICQDM